jgi:hypothetical protein
MVNYDRLPENLRGGMRRYIEHGIKPGDFLTAVLEDSLTRAFGQADSRNQARMFEIASWMYNECPPLWGSAQKVKDWIDAKAKEREAA